MEDINTQKTQKIIKKLEVSKECFYLLKYSRKDNENLEDFNLISNYQIDQSKYFVELEGSKEAIRKFIERNIYSKLDNKIISIEIEDDYIDSILDPKDHSSLNPSFPLSFTKYIYNYAFIPKDQLQMEEFQ